MGGIILRGDQYLMSGLDLYEAKLSLIWIFFLIEQRLYGLGTILELQP
jgi:hypothetical protein